MPYDIKSVEDLDPSQQTAEARREIANILLATIRDIELQLGVKERTDITGARMSAKDYQIWRRKAIKKMNHLTAKYRQYKSLEKVSYATIQPEADTPNTTGNIFSLGAALAIGRCGDISTSTGYRSGEALQVPPA